jgi:hypothetical protein
MRISTDHERNALKTACRAAVHVCGPAKQITAMSRISESRISICINRETEDFLPLDVALEVDRLAGAPLIVEAMARMLGYRLVPEEQPEREKGLTHRDLSSLSARFAEVQQTTHGALDDNHVDPGEGRDIQGKLAKLKHEIAAFEGKVGGGA